jgi:hypothetical protein
MGVKLTTHLQPVPRTRKYESIHPLPNTPSWYSQILYKSPVPLSDLSMDGLRKQQQQQQKVKISL